MNPANIRRSEAQQRSASVRTESYQVLVDLTGRDAEGRPLADPEQTFLSTSTVRFHSDGQPTWIDLIADQLVSASLDGDPLSPGLYGDNRLLFAPEPGEHELTVTAVCRYSHTGEGLHRFVDPADGAIYLYSQFESADARRMYACFEQPDLKATFALTVIAPADWTVVSNSPTPEPEDAGDDRQRWSFAPTAPIATYISALVAGEYAVHQGTVLSAKGELPANLICRKSMQPYLDAERIMLTTRRGFEVYEAAFGRPYPFDKYDQAFVPEYNAGAMENAGCVTIRDEYLYRSKVTQASYETRDNTILHELAHMWFGDLVTMRWWDDLWLNESFAEWASHYSQNEIATRYGGVDPWTAFANQRKVWAYRQDQLPTTHPVAADMVDLEAVEQNFDGITYAKGASVLKQLVAYVGQDQFLAGVRAYLDAHAFGNASLADLLAALEEASGRDLSDFTRQWLTTSGLNTIRADVEVDDEGRYTRVELVQSAPADFPVLRTHRLALGLFDLTETGLTRTRSVELDVSGESTPVPALVGQPQPDLLLVNDADLTYAKVRLDERSLANLTGHLDQLTDPLARAVAWTMLYDMARDAELVADDYAELVLRGIATERDSTAISAQLSQARQLAIGFTAPEQRPSVRARLVAGLARLLKDALPGSDLQLAVADNLILAVDSPAGIDMLKGWLEGFDVPFGLPIEADRRWAILTSLARLGAIGEQDIVAEARRDPTITGAEAAAGVRSALADPDAKRTAWHLATADPDVPNGTHLAICRQFWQYGQEELLAPYRERYLELCTDIAERQGVWQNRGHAASQAALSWLFPTPLADEAFIDQLDAWVAQHRPSPTVGRVLAEQRDNAVRAIRGQELTPGQA